VSPREADLSTRFERLDRLPVTGLHWRILIVCAFGLLFDVVEAGLGNALSAVFSAPPYKVSATALSFLLASVFIGGIVGAPLLGIFADRHGRRTALATSLLILTVTSLLAASSPDIVWLTACRVLSGLALGAYPALMATYLADVLPPKRRGTFILISAAGGFLGAPVVVFLIASLTPLQPLGVEGWRWTLAIGAAGSAIVGVFMLGLPESPRWLWTVGRGSEADAACARFETAAGGVPQPESATARIVPASAGVTSGQQRRLWSAAERPILLRALPFAVLEFLSPWPTIGFPLMIGAVLVAKGFRVADSLFYVGVTMFGPTLGVLLAASLIDRVERRMALALAGGAMALCGILFALSDAPLTLMSAGLAFQLIGAIYVTTLNVYAAEAFPTELRAAVSSSTWAVNRVAAALAPLALLPLLKSAGVLAMFSVIAGVLVAGICVVVAFGPRGLTREPLA